MNAKRLLAHYSESPTRPMPSPFCAASFSSWPCVASLVDQDPNDEPAQQLLNRIAVEKQRLVTRQGKIKKPKHLPEIATQL